MKQFKRAALIAFISLISIIPQTACQANMGPVSGQGFYLDTICTVTIYSMEGMSEEKAGAVIDGAFSVCADYEKLLSKTAEGSDIWKINHAGGAPVVCDERTIQVIEKGLSYSELSGGRFDITIGPVSALWDFHSEHPQPPPAEKLAAAVWHVDYRSVTIDGDTVSMGDPEAAIDLGGIAKGYIADRMVDWLKEQGVSGAVVDLGGNIAALGYKDGKRTDFNIGIRDPFEPESGGIAGAVQIHDATLVTSGTYERSFEEEGVLYHHILDVKTGLPVKTDLISVTVIGPGDTSEDCDALATTCLILGRDEGLALIDSLKGYEAVFIGTDGAIAATAGSGFTEE